ncbi:MAG: vitamin B12-dependent ribonucleotide reductase [Planctomycetota bacterium]|jgi:ribonucleoside-diphosphate reductase alpha chain
MVVKATKYNAVTDGKEKPKGLRFEPAFCPEELSEPFDSKEWEIRTARIESENGEAVFEQKEVSIPTDWSALATNVVVSKYFYGEQNTSERETSVRQLIDRVAGTIADWGLESGYFASKKDRDNYYRDLAWLCLHQYGAFNSPVWFNVGLFRKYGVEGCPNNFRWSPEKEKAVDVERAYEYPQVSACFIQSVKDTMKGIMELAASEAMLFKYGSGTGSDLTPLRSYREKLAGGGKPSGPISFMQVYDRIASVIKSGGKTRRAAKMQSLKVTHPDILEFIEAKTKEEAKAHALIRQGYDANFNGEAYSSVFFQNANFSVRVTDEFMQAVERDEEWTTRWVTQPDRKGPSYDARFLLEKIAEGTWQCGDPGLQYDTTINQWHTSTKSGPINASNPCSEYMFLDDSACNLASLNLMKFRREDGTFDVERFRKAVRIFITAQEIVVDHASYPTPVIAENSHRFRPLGLGYTNLGALLMASGTPYDSEEGRALCGAVTAIMTGQAYLTSSEIAGHIGPFDEFEINREPMLNVMRMHRDAVDEISDVCPGYLHQAAKKVWDQCLEQGFAYGYRNAQATVLAPTGTISFLMDCDTTGIEPDLALIKYKQLAGGGMLEIVNRTIPLALDALGYDEEKKNRIWKYIEDKKTVEGCSDLDDEHLPVFDCAFSPENGKRSIDWRAHLRMMAAAQPFLSGAISKTVNMPKESTVEDIAQAYIEGWRLGLKALAIYRDGSKESQPLSTSTEGDKAKAAAEEAKPRPLRKRLPDTRASMTHKFSINGHEGYLTVGLYKDGKPGEVFLTMAKEGSTIGGLMDVLGTVISMCLQYGVPLEVLVDKFSHARFEPSGWTSNPDVPVAKSIVDYIFRWLGIQFIPGYREKNAPKRERDTKESGEEPGIQTKAAATTEEMARMQQDTPPCDNCGALTVRVGMCYLCYNCGSTSGCG